MNAAVRAVTLFGHGHGLEVLGVRRGYRGLLDGALVPLRPVDVASILREGGTCLGSARCPEFHQPERRAEARRRLREAGVEGLVVVGGNGSLTGLAALTHPDENATGLRGVGIPASIDNDIGATRLAIGVDTAVNTIVEACDKISDTASAHDRTFIVEVMGRDCGYLAMTSGIAAGANAVLFPEMDKTEDEIVDTVARAVLRAQQREGTDRRVLVIKAEGVKMSADRLGARLAERLVAQGCPAELTETRVTVLGHVVRGGRPSALDRQIGSRLGRAAVEALLSGRDRLMAAWSTPSAIPHERSPHDPQCSWVSLDRVLEATQDLLGGRSELTGWRAAALRSVEEILAS